MLLLYYRRLDWSITAEYRLIDNFLSFNAIILIRLWMIVNIIRWWHFIILTIKISLYFKQSNITGMKIIVVSIFNLIANYKNRQLESRISIVSWFYCGSSKLLWISLDVTMVIYVYVSIQYSMRYFVPIKWLVKNLWKHISQTRLIRKIVPKGKNWRFRKNHKTIAVCKIQQM